MCRRPPALQFDLDGDTVAVEDVSESDPVLT